MTTTPDLNDHIEITNLLTSHYLKGAISGKGSEMKPTFHNDATWYGYVGEDLIAGSDNIINPGEQVELFIILFNDPNWGDAINLQAELIEDSPYLTMINENAFYGDIAPGEAMIIEPFIININEDAPETDVEFELNITSNENGYIKYIKTIPLTYSI